MCIVHALNFTIICMSWFTRSKIVAVLVSTIPCLQPFYSLTLQTDTILAFSFSKKMINDVDSELLFSCMKATMPLDTKAILRHYDRNKEIRSLQTLFCCKVAFLCKQQLFDFFQTEKRRENQSKLELPFPKNIKFVIGMIGCGSMGKSILEKLHSPTSPFQSHQIIVSTRRPNILKEQIAFPQIETCFDNGFVAQHSHVLILSVLPSQLHLVASEIKPHVQQHQNILIVSLISGVSREKLVQLLNVKQVITLQLLNATKSMEPVKGISAVKFTHLPFACPILNDDVDEKIELIGDLYTSLVSYFETQIAIAHVIGVVMRCLLGIDFGMEQIVTAVKDKSVVSNAYHYRTLEFVKKMFV